MRDSPLVGRAHNRQFIIDRSAHQIGPDWKAVDLVGGYVLSHCPNLRLRPHARSAGNQCVLIGHAFQAHPQGEPVDQCLAAGFHGDPWDQTYGWSGRWVVISEGLVLGDFSNSLGLFYRRDGEDFVVSSSLAILYRLRPTPRLVRRRFNRRGMNWTPPPATKMQGVRKLLPDQAIDLRAGSIRHVTKSRLAHDHPTLDTETVAAHLLAALQRIWTQMAREFRRLRLALTAGLDSRTLMAAGLRSGAPFDAVTLQHGRISLADRELPGEICTSVGVPHRYVSSGNRRQALERLYDQHTLADIDEADRDFFRRDMFHWLEEGDCLVRGAAFGLGRRHFHPVLRGLSWEMVARDPVVLVRRFWDFASFRLEAAQISEWIEWRSRHPGPFGWIEMFHLDQRLCGWAAAGEQGLDLLSGTSLNPANCGYILELLLSADPSAQPTGAAQLECIRQSGTKLERFAVNPVLESPWSRAAGRCRQIVQRATVESANFLGI